jgi:hypothetical protein
MAMRHPNHRLVKIHRTYEVDEIATLFSMHRNTVRHWIKDGLETLDQRRPILVQGATLVDFLKQRRVRNKRPCQPGQIYCLRCREPRRPVCGEVLYQAITGDRGRLVGLCPDCGTRLFRGVSKAKLTASLGSLELRFTEAQGHIGNSPQPSLNCDFNKEPKTHD